MAPVEVKVLVQNKGEIDSSSLVRYILEHSSAKLVLFFISMKDDVACMDYMNSLVESDCPHFIAVRVSGIVSPEKGYMEEAVAAVILCGGFDANVFREEIDFEKPSSTAEKIIPNLVGGDICLVYSANYVKQLVRMDSILRRMQSSYPELKIFGGASSPDPMVATNEGVFTSSVACAVLKGVDLRMGLYTGFEFQPEKREEITVTKADEFHVYEINCKKAVEEYSRIKHLRPYFINMLASMLAKKDMASITQKLAKTSGSFYKGVIRWCVEIVGETTGDGLIEPFPVLEANEEKGALVSCNYKPEGTTLKRLVISKEKQLEVYDRIAEDYKEAPFVLINSCCYTPFWFDFDFDGLEERLQKIRSPYLLYFIFGEYGTYHDKTNPNRNVVHNCTIEALEIK